MNANTPGYNFRIAADKSGWRRPTFWSMRQLRNFPVKRAGAEPFLALDQADRAPQ
jgi:hypothetical protein